MLFRQIFESRLAQYTYLIGCQRTGEALLIDPLRDIDQYLDLAEAEKVSITAVAETHIHADFLSGAREFAERTDATVYLSDEGGADWRYRWPAGGDPVVRLRDGDAFRVGNIDVEARHTPGHTPEHLSFLITDRGGGADAPMGIASGDFVFVGALGRPDLLETAAGEVGAREPAARALFHSVQQFLELPDYLQVWPGHGAGSACGKALGSVPETTVGYERRFNPSITIAAQGEQPFVDDILDGQPETPLYFARMKRWNRDGVPLLGELPRPPHIAAARLAKLAASGAAILDTRADRSDFMRRHLPKSLYAPLNNSFPTVAGSYLSPEETVYLVVEQDALDEAVRNLVRVGIDQVAGYTAPAELTEAEDALTAIPEISMAELEQARREPGIAVVDVRQPDEHRAGHVPGAHSAPHVRLPEHVADLPPDRQLLVHCQAGARAAVAAALLAARGRRVIYVNGSFDDWVHANAQAVERGGDRAQSGPVGAAG